MAEVQQPQPEQTQDAPKSGTEYYYNAIVTNPLFQQAASTYDWTKHSCTFLENTLDRVEQNVAGVAQYANQKASETYTNYYVRPKEAVTDVVNAGVEKTRWALETSKSAAVQTGTVGIGAAVLVTQLGLQLSAGGAGLVLDSLGAAQGAGRTIVTSVRDAEKAVEQKIWNTINEVQKVAMVPVEKAAETTHSILDVVRALVERSLDTRVDEHPDYTIKQRVSALASAVVAVLSNKAHEQVIDPVQAQMKGILEQLSKSFVLVDLVRAKKEWALEKVEELSASVSDLKTRFEEEAKQYSSKPEEMLMKSIRSNSDQLRERLENLKTKGHKVFGDSNGNPNKIESAITYLQQFDTQLGQAGNIYEVRDEVLSEARQRLAELAGYLPTNIFSRNSNQ